MNRNGRLSGWVNIARTAVLLTFGMLILGLDVTTAVAQSNNCARLAASLRTLERNSELRDLGGTQSEAAAVAQEVQNAESRYVSDGCNDAARAGQTLSKSCQQIARVIVRGRTKYTELTSSLETGNGLAQQREAILQEIARFGCGTDGGSSVDFQGGGQRKTLLEQLFGSPGGEEPIPDGAIYGDEFSGFRDYNTVRTVCVRKCDGYYWPVSYSTLVDYAGNDAQQCAQQCPGADTELYYYSNPGQEAEQMVSLYGEAYMSLPNALRYRAEYDPSCSCKAAVTLGSINLGSDTLGQSRAVIEFGGANFPLPMRDPRSVPQVVAAVDTTVYASVPLPRKRPAKDGEPVPVQSVEAGANDEMRLVQFGDKVVRIVGPETPYAQVTAAGT
ncbi:MAG: hypothetical protein JWR75_1901 [Devosia sp.]|nr:hypothetical protein [Devosia sp.]